MFSNIFVKLPKNFRFIIIFVLFLILFFSIARVVFYISFNDSSAPLTLFDTLKAMWIGLRFDTRMSILIILPFFFLSSIKYLNPFKFDFLRYVWLSFFGLIFGLYIFFYVFDFGYYAYLNTRLDFNSLRFLENASISARMVWESYNVIPISIAIIIINLIFLFLVNYLLLKIKNQDNADITYLKASIFAVSGFFILLILAYSKLSQYPLRWSDATFSKHPFATQLAYNPIHYFFDTWKNGRVTYDKDKLKKYYSIVSKYLNIKNTDIESFNFRREVTPINPINPIKNKPNVVMIILESFASYKSSVSNNPLDPSPNINFLANNGLYFKNFFTPSTGTARSIYCTLTGLPDVELKGTSSRNPLIAKQHSIISDFKGYKKLYFIGGSASWGNIRGMLNQSMPNLNLYEEGSYSSPRNDVWGISDIDLLREAHNILKDTKEPFFSIIQTSGNHRPYTIPNNSYGFKARDDIKEKEIQKYGFQSKEEYNSFRFMDYSVGHFIKLAKKSKYFKNTIFVFWGDHGISGNTGEHTNIAENNNKLDLGALRVPFIIYSPLIKKSKVYEKVVSEVDIMASVASLANISYTATALGRNMFDESFDDKRYAFTISHSSNPLIGLIGNKYYFRTRANGENANLYNIYSQAPLKNYSKENEKLFNEMKNMTYGIYEASKYIPYFNK